MIYPYICKTCNETHDILKGSEHASREERCPTCDTSLTRIWTVPQISCTHTLYSKAHGMDMANKIAVKDMQKRYHDTTGSEMIPIGNEKPKFKPKRQEYDLPRELKAKIYAN